MSEIVLAWTAATIPVRLRSEAKQDLYPLIVAAQRAAGEGAPGRRGGAGSQSDMR